MGQRHQLFVIARPKPGQRYRSLAAVHYQSLCGLEALQCCFRLLRIFYDEANLIALKQELAFAANYFDTATDEELEALQENNPEQAEGPCPFPFITTCLILGASCNPVTGCHSSVSEEKFGMAFDEGDNNDGVTIIDITELSDIRYCFVNFRAICQKPGVPLYTPLSGWDYLESYYDIDGLSESERWQVADDLEELELVEMTSLAGVY